MEELFLPEADKIEKIIIAEIRKQRFLHAPVIFQSQQRTCNKMSTLVVVIYLLLAIEHGIADRIIIHTSNQTGAQYEFFPLRTNVLRFAVKATNDVLICLTNTPAFSAPYYEIGIGVRANSKSQIRKDNKTSYKVEHFGALLNQKDFQMIWVIINDTDGSISVGKRFNDAFMYYKDPDYVKMSYFGISTGYGSFGEWNFDFGNFNCECCRRTDATDNVELF